VLYLGIPLVIRINVKVVASRDHQTRQHKLHKTFTTITYTYGINNISAATTTTPSNRQTQVVHHVSATRHSAEHYSWTYINFRWGSGSPIKWLFWLTTRGPQPLRRISALLSVVPRIHTELDRHTFFCCCSIHMELTTCWHSTVRKHSHFQMPHENPSVQTHLVLLCCLKRLCIFGLKGTIQIRYYYYLLLLYNNFTSKIPRKWLENLLNHGGRGWCWCQASKSMFGLTWP